MVSAPMRRLPTYWPPPVLRSSSVGSGGCARGPTERQKQGLRGLEDALCGDQARVALAQETAFCRESRVHRHHAMECRCIAKSTTAPTEALYRQGHDVRDSRATFKRTLAVSTMRCFDPPSPATPRMTVAHAARLAVGVTAAESFGRRGVS